MANVIYTSLKSSLLSLDPSIDFDGDTIQATLVTAAYTPNAAHQYYSSLAGVVATAALAGKSVTAGVFNATSPTTFTAVPAGAAVVGIVLWKDTGNPATSPLIVFIDQVASGLPKTPDGSDIQIYWDTGANKILKVG